MGFVDGDGGDVPGFQVLLPVIEHEALGGDVEETPFVAVEAGETRAGLGGRKRGVEKGCGDAGGLELVHLVLHQRDERGDDDGQAGAVEGGDLKAEGFAASGGEECEDIAAGEGGFDDVALERAELGVTEGGVEGVEEFGHGRIEPEIGAVRGCLNGESYENLLEEGGGWGIGLGGIFRFLRFW